MTSRSTTSKRGASKPADSSKNFSLDPTSWLWLLSGLVIGFFGAVLIGLTTSSSVDVASVTDKGSAISPEDQEKESKPIFDFYTLLPESEVTLPMADLPSQHNSAQQNKTKNNGVKDNFTHHNAYTKYLLQVGSFRNVKDADRLKAKLLLQGLNPVVEMVNVGINETWYRVQLGPFMDRSSLHKAQKNLAIQNIDSLLLQLK